MGSLFKKAPDPVQSTTFQRPKEMDELLSLAMPGVREFAASVPQRYQGSKVAGFDPLQTQGQQMALDAVGAQQNLAGSAAGMNEFLMGDIWNPASNPHLQGAIDAATRPITERFTETVLPGIRGEAMAAGQQFGGSRRGVAEGIASRDYLRQVGDTSSKLVQDQYANNLNAVLKAIGMTPQTQQAQLAPGMTTSAVGDVRQSMDQALLNEDVGNFNYDQYAPFLQAKEIMSLASGIPGGTNISTATSPQPDRLGQIIGAATTVLPFLMS